MDETGVQTPPEAPKARKPRRDLQPEGAAILEAYWAGHPDLLQLPALPDRRDLLHRIKQIPGCDFYDHRNVAGWFQRRLEKKNKERQKHAQFPSLSEAVLGDLKVLVGSQSDPSPEVVKTWAELLKPKGATFEDIVSWIAFVQKLIIEKQNSSSSAAINLPTPSDTATPEPSASVSPQLTHSQHVALQMKRDPTYSPVVPPSDIRFYQHRQESEPQPSTSPVSAHIPTPIFATEGPQYSQPRSLTQNQPPRRPPLSLQVIIDGITEGVLSQKSPQDKSPAPTTPAEFVAMFAPYESTLTDLLHAFQT